MSDAARILEIKQAEEKAFALGMEAGATGQRLVDAADSSNWQIRIEALRAASRINEGGAHRTVASVNLADHVLDQAKRFERYLESGE